MARETLATSLEDPEIGTAGGNKKGTPLQRLGDHGAALSSEQSTRSTGASSGKPVHHRTIRLHELNHHGHGTHRMR